jgi:hypothetical protein
VTRGLRIALRALATVALLGVGWSRPSRALERAVVAPVDTFPAGEGPDTLVDEDAPGDSAMTIESAAPGRSRGTQLEALVPELAAHPYRLEPGPRKFLHRMSVSPAYGFLGSDRLFALRVSYDPEPWFGYEASFAHDPGHAVHALLHTLSVVVRRPVSGRLQPYLSGGYGMMIVYPGQAVDAAPVTKNTLTLGGGLELYVRNDLALRADLRGATVFGQLKNQPGIVTYNYAQGTIGLAFYRTIRP